MSAKKPASSLYTPENISAPNRHTRIAIINFVKFIIRIIRVIRLSRKLGNSELHIKDSQGITPLLYSTKIQLIFITTKYFTRKFNLRLLEKNITHCRIIYTVT